MVGRERPHINRDTRRSARIYEARGPRNENLEAAGKVSESRDHRSTLYLTPLLTTLTDTFRGFYIIRAAVKFDRAGFSWPRQFFFFPLSPFHRCSRFES